jgi:hypothetical protein
MDPALWEAFSGKRTASSQRDESEGVGEERVAMVD